MDAITSVAVFGFLGTLVTVAGGIVTAIVIHKGEKKKTAEATLEKAYEQRLLLKREKIEELTQDVADANDKADMYKLQRDHYKELLEQIQQAGGPDELHTH